MSRSTIAKYLVCLGLVGVSFLHPHSAPRLLLVELSGGPLRIALNQFPGLFFRDKPYYNMYGALAVTVVYAVVVFIVWSLAERYARRRRDRAV